MTDSGLKRLKNFADESKKGGREGGQIQGKEWNVVGLSSDSTSVPPGTNTSKVQKEQRERLNSKLVS
jgi:hypothetical protein